MDNKTFALYELADLLGADIRLSGKAKEQTLIKGLASLSEADENQLAYCASRKYLSELTSTRAAAVLVNEEIYQQRADDSVTYLVLAKPELGFAALTKVFSNYPDYQHTIHPSACVHEQAKLAEHVSVCANAVIEKNVVVEDGCVIGPGSVVGENSRIGKNTRLFANVSVYQGVVLGENCIIHSGTVLGSDGFGFVPSERGLEKLYQLGGLVIGDRVEMGSNCTIDRGALGDTFIGHGVKMDNQVHIAHNVCVGENTAFAGCVGVAGSTRIGADCQFGGQVGINGHIEICDGVVVTGASVVMQSILEPGVYSGGVPAGPNKLWLKNALRFNQLSEMAKSLKRLEQKLG